MQIIHTRDYREARRAEYPDIGDQLDAIMKYFASLPEFPYELPIDVQRMVEQCQAVKAKYPKPQ